MQDRTERFSIIFKRNLHLMTITPTHHRPKDETVAVTRHIHTVSTQTAANPITCAAAYCDSMKRKQILDGARAVFLRDGFDGASMNDITRAAGVSKGTVYAYFRSKESLFETLIREDRSAQVAQVFVLDMKTADPADILFHLGMQLARIIADPDTLAQLRIVIGVASKFPNIGEAFFEAGPLAGKAHLADYFAQLHLSGALHIADTTRAASHFIELCRSDLLMRGLLKISPMPDTAEMETRIRDAVSVFLKAYKSAP